MISSRPGCPTPPGKAPHVAEITGPGQGRIYRVQIVAELKNYDIPFEQMETAQRLKVISNGSDFLRSGAYAFAVLVNEETNKARFEEALPALMNKLPDGACVVIETVPSPNNLPLFFSRLAHMSKLPWWKLSPDDAKPRRFHRRPLSYGPSGTPYNTERLPRLRIQTSRIGRQL